MPIKTSAFDVSAYLENEKMIAEYLCAIVEENDPALLLAAIGDIAKARGMSKIALESGLGRESLYKALNAEAKPRFDTVLKVLRALGVNIRFTSRTATPKPHGRRRKTLALDFFSKHQSGRTDLSENASSLFRQKIAAKR